VIIVGLTGDFGSVFETCDDDDGVVTALPIFSATEVVSVVLYSVVAVAAEEAVGDDPVALEMGAVCIFSTSLLTVVVDTEAVEAAEPVCDRRRVIFGDEVLDPTVMLVVTPDGGRNNWISWVRRRSRSFLRC